MLFSIIYSIDVPEDVDPMDFAPPHVETLWDKTEGDSEFGYAYLEGRWANGMHRKWCAILTRKQFDEFVSNCSLRAEDSETMGSIGFGWAPAISFNGTHEDAIQSAYVTPIPEIERKSPHENDWERVRDAVLAVYG